MSRADQWNLDGFVVSLTAASPNTVSAYQRDVRLFVEWVDRHGVQAPTQVTKQHIRSYVAFLTTSKLARRSISRKKAALARYFGWLSRNRKVKVDPTVGVKTPSDKGRLPKVLTAEQLRALLEHHPQEHPRWRHLRDDAVVEMLYGSGLRVSELCSLDVDSIDARRGIVRVMGKGSKERQVPVSKPAVDAVRGVGPAGPQCGAVHAMFEGLHETRSAQRPRRHRLAAHMAGLALPRLRQLQHQSCAAGGRERDGLAVA
ncbi:MAG: tyrosine recombinase XerC, partial [Actinomycetota bacterium]